MKRLLLASLLFAASAFAQTPAITAITPTTGPTTGYTHVTITGTNFTACIICSPPIPPRVFFGNTEAIAVTHVSLTEIEAIAPPHAHGYVAIRVVQWDNQEATSTTAFLFDADLDEGRERVLVPLFVPPVAGQNGSEFRTDFRIVNKHDTPVTIYGFTTDGTQTAVIGEMTPAPIGNPGRFLYVPDEQHAQLWMNLRAYDTSRAADNFGTQIPLPREKDFVRGDVIVLSNVPTDPKFRSTLRIYSTAAAGTMSIAIASSNGTQVKRLELQPGANEYEPAYAMFTDFPVNVGPIRVEVEGPPIELIFPPREVPPPIWAFISVTNNETQMITTITP